MSTLSQHATFRTQPFATQESANYTAVRKLLFETSSWMQV